jgi:hypothetical protein
MKFKLEIECGNDAFGDTFEDTRDEVARILSELSGRIARNELCGGQFKVFDHNGNRVGFYGLYPDPE